VHPNSRLHDTCEPALFHGVQQLCGRGINCRSGRARAARRSQTLLLGLRAVAASFCTLHARERQLLQDNAVQSRKAVQREAVRTESCQLVPSRATYSWPETVENARERQDECRSATRNRHVPAGTRSLTS
jgi:hypothetical protein